LQLNKTKGLAMILITWDSEQVINAVNYEDAAEQLRCGSFDPRDNLIEFMEATANAVIQHSGVVISTYNSEQFITDLVANGYLISRD
jgi:hypothetical protein